MTRLLEEEIVDAASYFAAEWPATAARLARILARHGASPHDREDVLQETALRLYRAWDDIDQTRGVEPYARTVALNVWRDVCRRSSSQREVLGEVPDVAGIDDVDRLGMARAELGRVRRALVRLHPTAQRVLRDAAAAEFVEASEPDPAAVRMARMRARRQLAAALRTASVLVGVLAAGRRRLRVLRPTLASAGLGSLVAIAVLTTPHTSMHRVAPRPATPTPAAESRVAPAPAPAPANRSAVRSPSVRQERPAAATSRPAPERRPVRIDVGIASAEVYAELMVFGRGARVQNRGDSLPVCESGLGTPAAVALECRRSK